MQSPCNHVAVQVILQRRTLSTIRRIECPRVRSLLVKIWFEEPCLVL